MIDWLIWIAAVLAIVAVGYRIVTKRWPLLPRKS
jgi:hypothetical protein